MPGKECRVGVYVCHCGGNISDVVEVARVTEQASALGQVVVSRHETFMCSDPGQKVIADDIATHQLDRVVVAACSPSLHELTFRHTLERAGLNPYLYEHANIREQVSWCHLHDPEGATAKASRLVAAAVAKARLLVPLEPVRVRANHAVAVIGGGVAGMRAALDLADRGFAVHLVDSASELGGNAIRWGKVYPTDEPARSLTSRLVEKVRSTDAISLHLNTEVAGTSGFLGNFVLTLGGPDGQLQEVGAGAIILATGFESYSPRPGELGWGASDRVITLPDLLARLDPEGPTGGKLTTGPQPVRSLAFIHCVGSRQIDGVHERGPNGQVNAHCSRVCCTTVLHTACALRKQFPDLDLFDLYQDIRAYGRGHEEIYEAASRAGVTFFRYEGTTPPLVETDGKGELIVRFTDTLTYGEELELPVDMVVLATGMVPRDISRLVEMLKLPRSPDGFLQEVHPKLRPVELSVDGVFVAGTCQAPMDMGEASASASAAAVKAVALLAAEDIALPPFVAAITSERCDGCGKCVDECAWVHAITMPENARVPVVNAAICRGCGMCVAVCPHGAIDVRGAHIDQYEAMVDAIIGKETSHG